MVVNDEQTVSVTATLQTVPQASRTPGVNPTVVNKHMNEYIKISRTTIFTENKKVDNLEEILPTYNRNLRFIIARTTAL